MIKLNPKIIALAILLISLLAPGGFAISNTIAPGGLCPGEGTGAEGGG